MTGPFFVYKEIRVSFLNCLFLTGESMIAKFRGCKVVGHFVSLRLIIGFKSVEQMANALFREMRSIIT